MAFTTRPPGLTSRQIADAARTGGKTNKQIEKTFGFGGNEKKSLRDVSASREIANQDPLVRELKKRAGGATDNLSPEDFDRVRRNVADIGRGASRRQQQSRDLGLAARAQQEQLLRQRGADINKIRSIISGDDSLARRAASLQQDRARQAIASQLASRRGGFSPGAAREAQLATSQAVADIGGQAAMAAAQERRSALTQLLGAQAQQAAGAGALRQGDLAQRGADVQSAAALAQLQALQGQLTGAEQTAAQNLINMSAQQSGLAQDRFLDQLAMHMGQPRKQGIGEMAGGLVGSGLGFAGSLLGGLAASDERAKEGIADADNTLGEFLDALSPQSWRYKEGYEDGGAEKHTGVMAQDLERSEVGRSMVVDDGTIKKVDYSPGRMGPIVMAALANLNKRVREMEAE